MWSWKCWKWSVSWHFWGPVKDVITRILPQMRVGLSWDREDLARAFLSKVGQLMPSSSSPSSTWSWSLPPSSSRWSSSRPDRTTWDCLGRGRHSLGRRRRGGGTIWSTRVRSPLPADSGTMSRWGRILRLKRLCSKANNYPHNLVPPLQVKLEDSASLLSLQLLLPRRQDSSQYTDSSHLWLSNARLCCCCSCVVKKVPKHSINDDYNVLLFDNFAQLSVWIWKLTKTHLYNDKQNRLRWQKGRRGVITVGCVVRPWSLCGGSFSSLGEKQVIKNCSLSDTRRCIYISLQ